MLWDEHQVQKLLLVSFSGEILRENPAKRQKMEKKKTDEGPEINSETLRAQAPKGFWSVFWVLEDSA